MISRFESKVLGGGLGGFRSTASPNRVQNNVTSPLSLPDSSEIAIDQSNEGRQGQIS